MGVFNPMQGQVLFSPVSNFYQGKAVRQELADREQMGRMRELQIDEAEYQQSPERRQTQEEILDAQLKAARMSVEQAEIDLGESTMKYMAKRLSPITSLATQLTFSGDEKNVEAGTAYFNEEINRILPTLPKRIQDLVKKGAGEDHVYSPEEIAQTKLRLGVWLESQGADRKPLKVMVDGEPVQAFADKAGNLWYEDGRPVTGDVKPYDKTSPLVEIHNLPPDELRKPQMIKFFKEGSVEAKQSYAAVKAADNMLGAIDDGIFAGWGADAKTAAARVFTLMGDKDNPPEAIAKAISILENSQFFDTQGGILVGQIIKLFGSGTGLSDADREYAREIAAALRSMEPEALKRTLKEVKETKMDEIQSWNNQVDAIAKSDKAFGNVWKVGDFQDDEFESRVRELLKED